MNRAFIPLAAAATFVAVYQLTPAPAPARQAVEPVEPVAAAAAVPAVAAVVAARPAAAPAKRPADRPRASRQQPRRAAAPVLRPAMRTALRPAGVHYSGCNEVRAAGLAPLYRGEPGYRPEMDGDDDGIACEPHRRRGR